MIIKSFELKKKNLNKKINIPHHCLFVDTNFNKHVEAIYDDPKWPDNPLFYVSCTSKTDSIVIDDEPIGGYDDLIKLYS